MVKMFGMNLKSKKHIHLDSPGHGLGLSGKVWRRLCVSLLLVHCGASAVYAVDGGVHGSFKTFFLGLHNPLYQEELYGLAENTLRLDARIYPSDLLVFEGAYEITPEVHSAALAENGAADTFLSKSGGSPEYRVIDFNDRFYPVRTRDLKNLSVYHNLDRMYGSVYMPFGDLYLGRQAISWGSGHVMNPTDVIAPYSFTGLNTEEKRGVDALRLRMPVGAMSELDVGYAAGENFQYSKSALFARARGYLAETDVSVVVMDFFENLLLGVDASRAIGGAGSWVEAAYVLPRGDTDDQYAAASIGMDYNFGPKLYGYVEYHFNSAGKSDPEEYLEDHIAYTEGAVYLRGRHYAGLGGTYQLIPLIPVSGLVLVNFSDVSAYLSISAEYNFAENVYITGGAFIGIGEAPDTGGAGAFASYNSEFSAYPDLYYIAVKLYF